MDTTQAIAMLESPASQTIQSLAARFNEIRDRKLAACGGDFSTLAFEAIDLDLGSLLVQILPVLLGLFSGGFTLPSLLAIAKVLISFLLKDTELGNALFAILESLLKMFVS